MLNPLTLCILLSALMQPPGAALESGVTFRIFQADRSLSELPRLAGNQTPNVDVLAPVVDFGNDDFAAVPAPLVSSVTGWLQIAETGDYVFRLTSDDGSHLSIDRRLCIDHDGLHGATAMVSGPINLTTGLHELRIDHFDNGGSRSLRLEWKAPGADRFALVPTSALRTEADPTRVTSPGVKRVEDARRPGDGKALKGVHPSWRVTTIRPDGFEPKVGAMAFMPDGRLIVGTFDPLQRDETNLPDIESKAPDVLYALSGVTGDPSHVTVQECATDLYEPTGMCVVDGVLYVAHRRAITRLLDRDGDGYFETHEDVAQGWEGWNYHQFVFGLEHIDGKLYAALSTAMAPPGWEGMKTNAGPNGPMRGGILEVDLTSNDARLIAGGTRTPNGLGVAEDGALLYLDNQGTWMPTSQLCEVIPGRFYGHYNWTDFVPKLADRFPVGGHPSAWCDLPRTPAAVYLPQNEFANSPTQAQLIQRGPFAGQMLVGELTAGGIRRVQLERVNGILQGCAFRFTQGLESGVNRMVWGPDGALYIGGIGAGGNWNWNGTQFGLQRLNPTAVRPFEMHSVYATTYGFLIRFTQPVHDDWLADPSNYVIKQWTYEPTVEYGGPKIGTEILPVTRAEPMWGGDAVALTIPGLKVGHCVHIQTDPESRFAESMWSTDAYYTLNAIPREQPIEQAWFNDERMYVEGIGVGVLPPADAVPLIGRSAGMAMRYANEKQLPANATQDDLLARPDYATVGNGSGDLISRTEFGDCRLHVEWYAPPGGAGQMAGNSGVYLQSRYEIQVLGTPMGREAPAMNEAGAIYNVTAANRNASTGPGTWQAYDIWFRAPRFEDGKKIEEARITAFWNGVLVHNDVRIPEPTGAAQAGGEQPGPDGAVQLGPLRLQDHASDAEGPVRFRNVWIAPLAPVQWGAMPWARAHSDTAPNPWVDLLAETTWADWMIRGGEATFHVERNELVGETVPNTANTFYTSVETYRDFELLFEVMVDDRLNSGVQIRSQVIGGAENRGGGLTGYQVEIDPSERAYSAGIYDERGRGWLYPLYDAPYARRAFRNGQWNKYRVVADGPVMRTWINGVPAAAIFDARSAEGHLGFQVHGVGDNAEPMQVRFRNIRVRQID